MIAGVIQNGDIDLTAIEAEWGGQIAERVRHAMLCVRIWTFLEIVTMGEREFWEQRPSSMRREVRSQATTTMKASFKKTTPSTGGIQ